MNIGMRRIAALSTVCVLVLGIARVHAAGMTFNHTITGEDLKVEETAPPEKRDTPGVKQFLDTGVNPYVEIPACLSEGEQTYLSSCSGCHGHLAEGKVGPGLNDAYWTYPKNKTDKGLFETIFGGAQGMMGPHNDLALDDTLKLMAWIRHLYAGDVAEADWLTDAQKAKFKPYAEHKAEGSAGEAVASTDACKPSGG